MSDFLVMKEMADQNMDISAATQIHSMKTHKKGGLVTVGVDAETLKKLALGKKHVAVLYSL